MRKVCVKHFEENCKICNPDTYMKNNNLNELYTKVDTWYKKQDQNLVREFERSDNGYISRKEDLQKVLYWYDEIKELPDDVRDYYLGNKEITFDILYNFLFNVYPVKNDKDLIKLASGDLDDDDPVYTLDYDLRISNSLPMIFAYLVYKLNWDKEVFVKHLYNSLQYTEELEDLFITYTMPSDDEIEQIVGKSLTEQRTKAEHDLSWDIKQIIEKYEGKMKGDNRIEILKQLLNE